MEIGKNCTRFEASFTFYKSIREVKHNGKANCKFRTNTTAVLTP